MTTYLTGSGVLAQYGIQQPVVISPGQSYYGKKSSEDIRGNQSYYGKRSSEDIRGNQSYYGKRSAVWLPNKIDAKVKLDLKSIESSLAV